MKAQPGPRFEIVVPSITMRRRNRRVALIDANVDAKGQQRKVGGGLSRISLFAQRRQAIMAKHFYRPFQGPESAAKEDVERPPADEGASRLRTSAAGAAVQETHFGRWAACVDQLLKGRARP